MLLTKIFPHIEDIDKTRFIAHFIWLARSLSYPWREIEIRMRAIYLNAEHAYPPTAECL